MLHSFLIGLFVCLSSRGLFGLLCSRHWQSCTQLIKILFHSVGKHLTWMMVPFLRQKHFSTMRSHLNIFTFIHVLLNSYSESLLLWLKIKTYFLLYPLTDAGYEVLCWQSPWSTWGWILCRVSYKNQVSFFPMCMHPLWPLPFCTWSWTKCMFGLIIRKSFHCRNMGLCLGSQFHQWMSLFLNYHTLW